MQIRVATRKLEAPHIETAGLTALLALAFVAYMVVLGGPKFRLDDAYIVLNNAEALFGRDTAFPETPALYGSTSLVHTMASAVFGAIFGAETGLMVLAWVSLGAFGLGVLELARQAGIPPAIRALVATIALTTGDLVQVLLNGLETTLAMAAVIWLIVLHRARAPILPIAAGVAPFVRPELLLLSGLVIADAVVRSALGRDLGRWLPMLLGGVGVFAALLALQVALSGDVFPATGDAKRHFFVISDLGAVTELRIGLLQTARFFLEMAPVSLLLLLAVRVRNAAYLIFAVALLAYFVTVQPLIMHQTYFRYLYGLVPLFVLGLVDGLSAPRRVMRLPAIVLMVAALAANLASAFDEIPDRIATVQKKHADLSAKAAWLERHVNPSTPIMIHDVGFLAYTTDHVLIDVVGLKSTEAAELNRRFAHRGGLDGRGQALAALARRSGARMLLVSVNFDMVGSYSSALAAQGWGLTPHPAGDPTGDRAFLLTPPPG